MSIVDMLLGATDKAHIELFSLVSRTYLLRGCSIRGRDKHRHVRCILFP